jgi:hypothetical protein
VAFDDYRFVFYGILIWDSHLTVQCPACGRAEFADQNMTYYLYVMGR